MATLTEVMADDLEALETANDFGTTSTITFNSTSYAATVSPFTRSKQMEDAGFLQQADIEVVVRCELFGTEPVENQKITVASETYRIMELIKDGVALTMRCNRVN